jgi:hypothetical protein
MSSFDGLPSGPNCTDLALVPCPACLDDRGEPTGDALVELPSGTWVRQVCEVCGGRKKVERAEAVETGRPMTVRPPFDPATFARESDALMKAAIEAQALGLPSRDMGDEADSVPDVQEVEVLSGAQDALGADAVPFLALARQEVARLDLGPDATRLLAYVNGISSLEAVSAKASITAEEGASLLLDLAERGVVGFR